MPTYKMLLQYDGSRYRGWQRLGDSDMTVQGKLEAALSRLFGVAVEISGSGRTDAGVHARGQTASFTTVRDLPPEALLHDLRRCLPEDIGVLSIDYAPPRFHARYSALEKTYCYRVWNSEAPCVFERRWVYPFPAALDTEAMERAAALLVGTHDFTAFCGNRHLKKSAVRTLRRIEIAREGEELRLRFEGDGFLYHMVRILVGTLLEVGTGERDAAEMPEILASKDRARAGFTAPAKGLILWDAAYR